MKNGLANLTEVNDKNKSELLQLKIEMMYQENAVKDAEVESTILQKRLRKAEKDARRAQKLLSKSLAVRKEIENKVNDALPYNGWSWKSEVRVRLRSYFLSSFLFFLM